MFYSQFILAKKGPLGTIWIAAHLERKLRKNQVADTDISVSVDSILSPEVPIALRLSSHLLLGVVRIYSRKVNYLFNDCSEALLKIKQAFRSTAVDLPPEESTAPYHSITLPETFHLDDFELPDAFQTDFVDRHTSTKEQITLQDNPERTGYSTSKFGLDETFGDGNPAEIGVDIDRDLMGKDRLSFDDSLRLVSDDRLFIQGQSSIASIRADVSEDTFGLGTGGLVEGLNDLTMLSSYDRSNHSASMGGYNLRTPDLNEMFLSKNNVEIDDPTTPFPHDEDLPECAPPATPGLVEETIPCRVQESPVVSPQQKDDAIKPDTPVLEAKDDDVASAMDVDLEPYVETVQSDAMERHQSKHVQNCDSTTDVPFHVMNGLSESDMEALQAQAGNPDEVVLSDEAPDFGKSAAHLVEAEGISSPKLPESAVAEFAKVGSEQEQTADFELEVCASVEPPVHENSVLGVELSDQVQGNSFVKQRVLDDAPGVEPEKMALSEFSELEKMMLAPDDQSGQVNDLGFSAAEKGILGSDLTVRSTSTLGGRMQNVEGDDMMVLENLSAGKVSSRAKKRSKEYIPADDDILASILVGKRTPGLKLGSSPPLQAASLKRPRLTPRTGTLKRKALLDSAMVLHADAIRQQLVNTDDIRRIRKKAPCTRSEVWMIEKAPLEDEIFNEPIFSGACTELNTSKCQIYDKDVSGHLATQNTGIEGQATTSERVDPAPAEANDEIHGMLETNGLAPSDLHPMELSNNDQSLAKPVESNDQNARDDCGVTALPADLDTSGHNANVDNSTAGILDKLPDETIGFAQSVLVKCTTFPADESLASVICNGAHATMADDNHDHYSCANIHENGCDSNTHGLVQGGFMQAEVDLQPVHTEVGIFENIVLPSPKYGDFEKPQCALDPLLEVRDTELLLDSVGLPTTSVMEEEYTLTDVAVNHGLKDKDMAGLDDNFVEFDARTSDPQDYGKIMEGVDTEFLNADDEAEHEEADHADPNPGGSHSLDNSGWSSRTRGVARYLKTLFDGDYGQGRSSVAVDHLVGGRTRKEASRMFFETLVLKSKDYIEVTQENPFDPVTIKPGAKLLKSEF